MRFIFKLISRLFTLISVIFALLYGYGVYLTKQVEEKDQALDLKIQSGNGFGGEAGMKIIDSEYSTTEFFWIDDHLLLFMLQRPSDENYRNRDNYIWDLAKDEVLPLDIEGSASCVRDGYVYYQALANPSRQSGERGITETFRSRLVRNPDRWTVAEATNIKEIWSDIPEHYEYAWRGGHECKPRYYLPRGSEVPSEPSRYYITYLSEWGWIYRRPSNGKNDSRNKLSRTGFYETGQGVYQEEDGQWKADSPELQDLRDFSISYIAFLDMYWIANRLKLNFSNPKQLGLLDRSGQLIPFAWSNDWPVYDAIPLPTRKGAFWDSRNPGTGLNNSGGYLLASDANVHKVIHGAVESLEVSPDGCKVAFFNRPKVIATGNSRLRIFDACNSSIHGREMTDVQYRDRAD